MKKSHKIFLLCCSLFLFSCLLAEKETALFHEVFLYEEMKEECTKGEIRILLNDMKCFPVEEKSEMSFENGYGGSRSYGGERKHEGIDIIPEREKEDYYQVLSATDGVVENIGWLELGGYRVGIRSDSGFYYYYAHLSSYEKGIKKGSMVKAGDPIGKMGNTGYGKEGTKGKFVIHLHFGVYRQIKGEEKSLNPYFLLQIL